MAKVEKGQKFTASGDQQKQYRVESVNNTSETAVLKQINVPDPVKPEPAELVVPVKALEEGEKWVGFKEAA